MDEKQLTQTTNEILAALDGIIDDLKQCLVSRDGKKLKETEKKFMTAMFASLPLFEDLASKKERTAIEEKILALLPSLQKLGLATDDLLRAVKLTLESGVPFTDKAYFEIGQIMGLAKSLAHDTIDVISTKNVNFYRQLVNSADDAVKQVDEYMLEHQQRVISGLCTPKASFLYLDMMQALRRIARELAIICREIQS